MTRALAMALILLGLSRAATAADRPNILFAIADDMSHASAYGYEFLNTPHFDRVAREGILFHRAYTPSSKCAPCRSVIITGRNPWQLEELANHQPYFPDKFKSVVEVLGEQGYFTGHTGKGWGPGIQVTKERQLTGPGFNRFNVESRPASGINKNDYAANFDDFLSQRPDDKPFFFWYGCKEPHRSYEYLSGQKNGKHLEDLDFLPSFWGDDETVKNDILDYAVEVEYFDAHLGRMLESLEEAGELDNTLVIVTSDNGMPFPRYKGHPHEFATRLPFAAMWKNGIKNPGRESDEFVSFIDLAPTFLEAANVPKKTTGMVPIEGQSLFDIFHGAPSGREILLTGRERNDVGRPHDQGYPVRSLHKGDFVYMHNFEPDRWPCGNPETGYKDTDSSPTKTYTLEQGPGSFEYEMCYGKRPQEELYNIAEDPECVDNLAGQPEYGDVRAEMKAELFAELERQGDPRMLGEGHVFDAYPHSKQPGFYDEFMAEQKSAQGGAKRRGRNRAERRDRN